MDSTKWDDSTGTPDTITWKVIVNGPLEEGDTLSKYLPPKPPTPELEQEIENNSSIDQTNGEESLTGYQDSPQKPFPDTSPEKDPEPQAEPQQEEPKPTPAQTETPPQPFSGLPEPQNFGPTQLKIDIPSMEVSDPRGHVSFRHDFDGGNY